MRRSCETKREYRFRQLIKGIIVIISFLIIFQFIYENSSLYYKSYNILRRRTVFSMRLNHHDLYLKKGEEFHLYVVALNKRVSFTSSDFRVAGVNFNGRVYGYQTGGCFILAKVDDKVLKCRVHVLDISKEQLSIRVGSSKKLNIRGSNSFVKWSSQDSSIAAVSMFGRVKGKRKGSTLIYANVKGKTFSCKVRVN